MGPDFDAGSWTGLTRPPHENIVLIKQGAGPVARLRATPIGSRAARSYEVGLGFETISVRRASTGPEQANQ